MILILTRLMRMRKMEFTVVGFGAGRWQLKQMLADCYGIIKRFFLLNEIQTTPTTPTSIQRLLSVFRVFR